VTVVDRDESGVGRVLADANDRAACLATAPEIERRRWSGRDVGDGVRQRREFPDVVEAHRDDRRDNGSDGDHGIERRRAVDELDAVVDAGGK
jgi:hypothetical protein